MAGEWDVNELCVLIGIDMGKRTIRKTRLVLYAIEWIMKMSKPTYCLAGV